MLNHEHSVAKDIGLEAGSRVLGIAQGTVRKTRPQLIDWIGQAWVYVGQG